MKRNTISFRFLAALLASAPLLVFAQGNINQNAIEHSRRAQALLAANPRLIYNPISVLVKFREDAPEPEREKARGAVKGWKAGQFDIVKGLELVATEVGVEKAIATLSNLPWVEYAEPDYVISLALPYPPILPEDHYMVSDELNYGNLEWGMYNFGQIVDLQVAVDPGIAGADIRAPEAWNVITGSGATTVAVIDTGINFNHPDFMVKDKLVPGYDFVDDDEVPQDENGHGTHVAGIIAAAANNLVTLPDGTAEAYGVVGVNWNCKIMPLRFLNANGSGYNSDAIAAINYASDRGVKISNNSWGGTTYDPALYQAIAAAGAKGHLFIAAAGNSRRNTDRTPEYPAAYNLDNILSVAATDNADGLASFSNYGAKTVDLGAPGVNIVSSYGPSPENFAWLSGTSMAAPFVTGVAALVRDYLGDVSYGVVRDRILNSVRPTASLAGKTVTGGVVDAYAALMGRAAAVPASPADFTIIRLADGKVELAWSHSSYNAATQLNVDVNVFEIQRQTYVRGKWTSTVVFKVRGNIMTYLDTTAARTGTYRYQVLARNSAGVSSGSGWDEDLRVP